METDQTQRAARSQTKRGQGEGKHVVCAEKQITLKTASAEIGKSPKPTANTELCEHDNSFNKVCNMASRGAVKTG